MESSFIRFQQLIKMVSKIIPYLITIAAIGVMYFIIDIFFSLGWIEHFTSVKGLSKTFGSFAEFTAIATGGLWLIKKIWLEANKRKNNYTVYLKELFILLKKHHNSLGLIATLAATGHGLYVLLKGTTDTLLYYSGIIALLSLAALSVFGIYLAYFQKPKSKKLEITIHKSLAIIFGITLSLHLLL